MAMKQHLLTAWVWQPTAADKRTGFIVMTKAEFDAAAAEGRAQDPRVGALLLKHITRTAYVPPEPDPPPETPARLARRRATPATEA